MCSGCSGDYAGDYEEPEVSEIEMDRLYEAGPFVNDSLSFEHDGLKTPEHRVTYFGLGESVDGKDFTSVVSSDASTPPDELGWEVLVGEREIVEIYFLPVAGKLVDGGRPGSV